MLVKQLFSGGREGRNPDRYSLCLSDGLYCVRIILIMNKKSFQGSVVSG